MSHRVPRTALLSTAAVTAALLALTAVPAQAAPAGGQPFAAPVGGQPFAAAEAGQPFAAGPTVYDITDALARDLAATVTPLAARVAADADQTLDLSAAVAGKGLGKRVAQADEAVLRAKGLEDADSALLQVRLAHPDMLPALRAGKAPLIAATPTDDTAADLVAYDRTGARVVLDVATVPARPVLMIEVDTAQALELGAEVLRSELAAAGVTSATTADGAPAVAAAGDQLQVASTGYWATKVTSVQVADIKEPFFKGNAEIFNIVGGYDLNGDPKVDIVEMPYLDKAATTYYPNQLLVHFKAYKWNLADVVMMEDDGDTNYKSLAIALVTALLTVIDGGAAFTPLVTAIIDAMPNKWWTDDPDYVDSWYTLSTKSTGRLNGAAGNAWMTVQPYWVAAL
ncbi:DUF3103 family protein [Melissospora conviva]|uniref:DUF3103 family protein n=1 Tax=Melissospora conviva TaxID=3388432 RepID=UPI003C144419